MAKIFFSYSHHDEAMRDQLDKHLSMLKRQSLIETWHDRRIVPGSALDDAIDANLLDADIVLLLVSPDFLASEYCYGRELLQAMQRHQRGEAKVVPVILRACDWSAGPLGQLLALPKDGRPISLWPDIDSAYLNVVEGLKALLPVANAERDMGATSVRTTNEQAVARAARSSNLRVRREFTDGDRHRFLVNTFEYLYRFFEGSVEELRKRHPNIDGEVTRVTARQFSTVLFRDGRRVSECCVTLTIGDRATGAGIAYSVHADSDGNSFNESLSVEADEQTQFLRSLGMWHLGRERDAKLTQEGGAELFWSILIEPLQQ